MKYNIKDSCFSKATLPNKRLNLRRRERYKRVEDEEKPRATVGGLKEMKRRGEGQRKESSEIKRR